MEMVKIRAKALIIEGGPNGIVVLNAPKTDRKGHQIPGGEGLVPAKRARELVDEGMAEFADDTMAPISPSDGDGGKVPAYSMSHVGGGYWAITGPGIDTPERIRGKTEAEGRMSELEDANDMKIGGDALTQGESSDGDGGAPI